MYIKDFNSIPESRILYRDDLFFMIADRFPVSPGHLLIISNELRRDYFELTETEKLRLPALIDQAKRLILEKHNPDGYNIGMNCGEAAGQTVFHFHCHVIPRYNGDMDDPRGGVRHCVENKGRY